MSRKRVTPEDLEAARQHIAAAKAEPVERLWYTPPGTTEVLPVLDDYGHQKIVPARLRIRLDKRVEQSLSFPPDRIKALRLRLGLTQAEAAARLAVTPRTWVRWELGDCFPSEPQETALRQVERAARTHSEPITNAAQIRQLRTVYNMTLEGFAAAYEVTPSTVVRWEAGHSEPRPAQRRRLSEDWQTAVDMGLIEKS